MRRPAFCICLNKSADKLPGDRAAAQFVSDLVGLPQMGFLAMQLILTVLSSRILRTMSTSQGVQCR